MASRIIAQILIMGAGYLGRAFVQAYQQALANSARSGGAAAGGTARSVRGRVGVQEASEILGVRQNAGLKDIYNKYEKLFNANDPAKGGSIYLQAKIYNAKVELEKAAIERGEVPPSPPDAQEGTSSTKEIPNRRSS